MHGWPGARYIALHTLSHLLIRTIALECGYSSASLSERIYAGADDPGRHPHLHRRPRRRGHPRRPGVARRARAAGPDHAPGAARRAALLVGPAVRRTAARRHPPTSCTAPPATSACSSPRPPANAATGSSTAASSSRSTTRVPAPSSRHDLGRAGEGRRRAAAPARPGRAADRWSTRRCDGVAPGGDPAGRRRTRQPLLDALAERRPLRRPGLPARPGRRVRAARGRGQPSRRCGAARGPPRAGSRHRRSARRRRRRGPPRTAADDLLGQAVPAAD